MTLIYETQTFKRSIPTGLEGEVNDFINQAKNQKPEDLKRLLSRRDRLAEIAMDPILKNDLESLE